MKIGDKDIYVQQYKNNWALALMSQGIIVKLSISRWGGTATLKPEELGLKFHDKSSKKTMDTYIYLGKEKLLPPEVESEIRGVYQRARNNLKQYSFPTVWGWFIPFTAFEKWESENEKIREEFFQMSAKIGENYNDIVQTVKEAYSEIGKDVWRRLYKDSNEPTASFLENFSSKIIEKIPSRTEIITSFKYDVTYFVIPMPSIIEENISRARELERKREIDDFHANLAKNAKKKISEEYVKRKQELIDGFLESTVSNMRHYVAELCESVLDSMSKRNRRKGITKSHKDKIKKMIEKVRLLNFYDDKEMNQLLIDLETEIGKFKGERDNEKISYTLQKIVDIGSEEFIPEDFNPAISSLEI